MSTATLQDDPSVESIFDLVATETLALFDHLSFEFLEGSDVFAPSEAGRTRNHEPPQLMRGFLHCYYKDIYGIRPVARELQNTFSGLAAASIDRRRETRSIAFSPTSNTSPTRSSTTSSSRLPAAACST